LTTLFLAGTKNIDIVNDPQSKVHCQP
jgi:hypothetical protein